LGSQKGSNSSELAKFAVLDDANVFKFTILEPSAFMMKISKVPVWSDVNAIFVPSGDQLGGEGKCVIGERAPSLKPERLVRLAIPVPSALIFQISKALGAVSLLVTKIKRLGFVGDQRGANAPLAVKFVRGTHAVPSALIL